MSSTDSVRSPSTLQEFKIAAWRFVGCAQNAKRYGVDAQHIGAWGGSAGGHIVGMLAGELPADRFVVGELQDISAALQASCVMAGPTDLTNEKFVENLRKSKEKSNSYQWLGKLYDDAPELYREASPLRTSQNRQGRCCFLLGILIIQNAMKGMAKLRTIGVKTKQAILKDGKHGCWMQRPWFEQCVDEVDLWFKESFR